MLILVTKVESLDRPVADDTIILTAEERQRSLFRCQSRLGQAVKLTLKRGTILFDGDILCSSPDAMGSYTCVQVVAKPEPVINVTADTPLALLKAAYHLGNRHVPLEVTESSLRLSQDPVLRSMLEKMPVTLQDAIAPFHPEPGAYHNHA